MIHLSLNISRGIYASISGHDYRTWSSNFVLDHIAVMKSITIHEKEVFDINLLDNITVTTSSLVADDKLFILPGVTIPRYKVRELGKKLNFNIVRNLSKASKVVYSKDQLISEMLSKKYESVVNKNELIKIYQHFNMPTEELDRTDISDDIILESCLYSNLREIVDGTSIGITDFSYDSCIQYNFVDDIFKQLVSELLLGTKVIISDQDVVKQCNGSTPINRESYTRLRSMLASNQNQEVAMEIICNCDYDQSMVYILKLLAEYNFYNMPGRNHVNYKSFRSYMMAYWDIDPNRYSGDIIRIIRLLASKGKLKKEYLTEFKDEILIHVQSYGSNDVFKISSIQMTDEYKTKLI